MRDTKLIKNSEQCLDMDSWYKTQLGQSIFKLEQQRLKSLPRNIFNENVLQLSAVSQIFSILNAPASHLFLVAPSLTKTCPSSLVQSTFEQLPFPDESIHTVILPHVLEFQRDPKIILTEAWRVLEPDGHLIVLGFNPWSLWGLMRHNLHLPQFAKFYSMGKLNYWLSNLNAEIVLKHSFAFAPPTSYSKPSNGLQSSEKALTWLFPNNGGIFLFVAKKQMIALTPIRLRWNWREIFSNKTLIEPAAGNVQRG